MIDLVCLVADKNMEAVVEGVLAKHRALGIRRLEIEVITHPQHDPGCYKSPQPFLRPFVSDASHAMVLLDRDWDGVPDGKAEELEADLNARLDRFGAQCGSHPGWARSVVIDPELEVWLFTRSPRLDDALGWRARAPDLGSELESRGLWPSGMAKPERPKATMQWAMSEVGKQKSSSIYRQIVTSIGLAKCTDRSFLRFQSTLRRWFPVP